MGVRDKKYAQEKNTSKVFFQGNGKTSNIILLLEIIAPINRKQICVEPRLRIERYLYLSLKFIVIF